MLTTLAFAVLAASPLKLAAPGLQGVGVDEKTLAFYTEHLADALGKHGIQVVTSTEMASMLGLERQRQLLGCAGEGSQSCLAEIAGGLGADGLVLGTVARVGDEWQLDVKVIEAHNGTKLATYQTRASTEKALVAALETAAASLWRDTLTSTGVQLESRRRTGYAFVAVGAVGLAAATAGALLLIRSAQLHDSLVAPASEGMLMPGEGASLVQQGKVMQPIGWVAVAGGAAAIATAAFLFAWRSDAPAVSVWLGPSGSAAFVFSGRFP